jgi:hypothetical protein
MRKLVWGAATVLMLLAISATVWADEEKVPLDQLPKEVTKAVKKKFPKAELVAATKEDMDGKPVYEVNIKAEDTTIDVTVTPDGKIVLIEKTIAAKDLPKKIAEALEAKYPKAKYQTIEEIIKDDKIEKYEILLVTADKKTLEVTFDPKGKFLDEEKKSEEKKEEKKDEKKSGKDEKGQSGQKGQQNQKGDQKEAKEEKGDNKKNQKDDEEDEKKGKGKKGDDDKDEKKGNSKKGEDDDKDEKKGKGKKEDDKAESKTVDLSKLPPDVAKKVRELVKELEKATASGKGKGKNDEDDDKKGKGKKGEDDK